MKKIRGFTLIELLVVIGILTILAGIAIPNYLHAQVRAKVARAHADMRTMASALEAYKVDKNKYPCSCQNGINDGDHNTRLGIAQPDGTLSPVATDSNGNRLACYLNCNDAVIMAVWPKREAPASWRTCFSVDPGLNSLTTPTAYLTSYPADPFATTQGLVYGYTNIENNGWILWSFGPDSDEGDGGEVGEAYQRPDRLRPTLNPGVAMNWPAGRYAAILIPVYEDFDWLKKGDWLTAANHDEARARQSESTAWSTYHPDLCANATRLSVCGYTYDPTNGIESSGDLWRVKQ